MDSAGASCLEQVAQIPHIWKIITKHINCGDFYNCCEVSLTMRKVCSILAIAPILSINVDRGGHTEVDCLEIQLCPFYLVDYCVAYRKYIAQYVMFMNDVKEYLHECNFINDYLCFQSWDKFGTFNEIWNSETEQYGIWRDFRRELEYCIKCMDDFGYLEDCDMAWVRKDPGIKRIFTGIDFKWEHTDGTAVTEHEYHSVIAHIYDLAQKRFGSSETVTLTDEEQSIYLAFSSDSYRRINEEFYKVPPV
jgi:hypothetical protein